MEKGNEHCNSRDDDSDDDSDRKMPAKDNVNSSDGRRNNKTASSIATEESDSSSTVELTSQVFTPTRDVVMEDSSAAASWLSHPTDDVDLRREQLYHQTIVLSITTTLSFGLVILTIIPIYIVAALVAFATSGGLLSYVAFNRLVLEYHEIVAGDGLIQFLPTSLVQSLTQFSLHQFLTDDTFVREWGFLAIYFVPGLSEEQLNNYIRRLPPEQRSLLNRRGLGYFFGDGFMRVLIGENRWRQHAIVGNAIEHPISQDMVPTARGLAFDSDGDNTASAVSTRDAELPSSVESTFALLLPSTPTPPNHEDDTSPNSARNQDDNQQDHFESHQDLIMNAIQDVVWGYARSAGGSAFLLTHEYLVEPALLVSGYFGLGISFLTMGAGIWQLSCPRYTSMIQSRASPFFMGTPFLIGTGLFGTALAGGMIYARLAIRSFVMGSMSEPKTTSKSTNAKQPQSKRFD